MSHRIQESRKLKFIKYCGIRKAWKYLGISKEWAVHFAKINVFVTSIIKFWLEQLSPQEITNVLYMQNGVGWLENNALYANIVLCNKYIIISPMTPNIIFLYKYEFSNAMDLQDSHRLLLRCQYTSTLTRRRLVVHSKHLWICIYPPTEKKNALKELSILFSRKVIPFIKTIFA